MHELLESEYERQDRKYGPEIFEPARVNNTADLKRVLAEFDPNRSAAQSVPLNARLTGEDESGKQQTYEVHATTEGQSKRSILLEGFGMIKRRKEVQAEQATKVKPILINGKEVAPASLQADGRTWVDPLVERWLGAYRDGLFICWNLDGVTYKYDIFEHKLFRQKIDATASS